MSVFIIAEAGDNHNGSLVLAKKLVDVASASGADCVKFQTFITDEMMSVYAKKARYQSKGSLDNESQYEMVKDLELSFNEFRQIKKYCDVKGIKFLSTPFDISSVNFLNKLGMDIFKIPSGEITNLPMLETIAKLNKEIIISTGMAEIFEIENALAIIRKFNSSKITVLHCNTAYPTPFSDVNLHAMRFLGERFNLAFGYSDHTLGIEVPIAAVALGASIIEKHFTLDKRLAGPDHKASLEPDELNSMVKAIRNIELSLGSKEKFVTMSERENVEIARKSIVAKSKIKKGEIFSKDNLAVKRPGNGISPMRWYEIIGKIANRDFEIDELIEE